MEEMWIARDRDGSLWIYEDEPWIDGSEPDIWSCDDSTWFKQIDPKEYPEVTWDNGPRRLDLKLRDE